MRLDTVNKGFWEVLWLANNLWVFQSAVHHLLVFILAADRASLRSLLLRWHLQLQGKEGAINIMVNFHRTRLCWRHVWFFGRLRQSRCINLLLFLGWSPWSWLYNLRSLDILVKLRFRSYIVEAWPWVLAYRKLQATLAFTCFESRPVVAIWAVSQEHVLRISCEIFVYALVLQWVWGVLS